MRWTSSRRPLSVLALGLLAAPLLPRDAAAYCCIPAKRQEPPVCLPDVSYPLTQAWNVRCVPFWTSTQGSLLDGDERRVLVAQSFGVWSSEPCTDLELFDAGPTDATEPGFDDRDPTANQNIVLELRPDQVDLLMGDERLAVTITAFSTATGEIFDADILLNPNVRFEDVSGACNPASDVFDLRNTLVHEIGHFLGFDHTPNLESTMAAAAGACEVKKRSLADFDLEGLCTVYPAGGPTATCAPPPNGYGSGGALDGLRNQCARAMGLVEEGGCTCRGGPGAARGDRGAAWPLILTAVLAGCWSSRRRARGARPGVLRSGSATRARAS